MAPSGGSCSVEFSPDGLKVTVPADTTILDAARLAGVPLDTMCGGEGTCGKCRAIVRQGHVEKAATELLSREEIDAGYVLACQARVRGPVTVEIPRESRVRVGDVEFSAPEGRLPGKTSPLVERHELAVQPPTLEFHRSDLDRLALAFKEKCGGESLEMGLEEAGVLPAILRKSGHKVAVTAAWRGAAADVLKVAPAGSARPNLGLAVDVGTTTVVAELIDVSAGKILGSAGKYNSQSAYGPDVIRRILWATERQTGLRQLHSCIAGDINALLGKFEEKLGISRADVFSVVAAGNTTMMHMLLSLNPEWIRREPYVGAVYRPAPVRAAEAGLKINERGMLYCLPCVSGFVGGDIVAGVVATGLAEAEKPRLLVDMGTNGEVVIGNKDWMVCASASAGPAFEGAGTRHGMRAMDGAIDHVSGWHEGKGFEFTTKGGLPAIGMCGTAYIDLLVHLLKLGVVDKTGRFNQDRGLNRLRKGFDSLPEFVVAEAGEGGAGQEVVITQGDLNNLLRAKGAIYAAVKLLLKSLGLKASDLEELTIAGAFGSHLDVRSAIAIGLLPDEDPAKLKFAGNTSLKGARAVLMGREKFAKAAHLADSMTYYELSTDPGFMEEFTSACFLPHTNIEEFPSVRRLLEKGKKGQ